MSDIIEEKKITSILPCVRSRPAASGVSCYYSRPSHIFVFSSSTPLVLVSPPVISTRPFFFGHTLRCHSIPVRRRRFDNSWGHFLFELLFSVTHYFTIHRRRSPGRRSVEPQHVRHSTAIDNVHEYYSGITCA